MRMSARIHPTKLLQGPSMQFNVAQLLKEPVGASRSYNLEDARVDIDDDNRDRPVHGEVRMLRIYQGILVTGDFQLTVKEVCSRCLGVFEYPMSCHMEEEFYPEVDIVDRTLVDRDDDAFTIDEKHILDLTEAVRQYAAMSLSMKPLCRHDCAGLCPNCGYNLNLGPCSCSPPAPDIRWAALQRLGRRQKDNN